MIAILSNILLLCLISLNNCAILSVSNSTTLTNALNKALAGDTIQLADGIYSSSISFKPKNNGTITKRITLKGSKKAILTAQNLTDALYLNKVNYWVLDGFTVQFSLRGILLDYSTNNILQNLNIGFIQNSAIRIRSNSTDNLVQNCTISQTGLASPGNGEGIYIANKRYTWNETGILKIDRSSRNRIRYNYFGPYVRSESVDIKESADNIIVEMNYFNGFGMAPDAISQAWVAVKGFNCTIQNNYGISSVLDGYVVSFLDRIIFTNLI